MRPSRGRMVLGAVFAVLSLSAWIQVWGDVVGSAGEPPLLTALQALTATAAAGTTWGAWIGARWAPAAALLYGVIAGGMVAGLGRIIDMPADERGGLWVGAAVILAFALWSAWWLRRSLRREGAMEMTTP